MQACHGRALCCACRGSIDRVHFDAHIVGRFAPGFPTAYRSGFSSFPKVGGNLRRAAFAAVLRALPPALYARALRAHETSAGLKLTCCPRRVRYSVSEETRRSRQRRTRCSAPTAQNPYGTEAIPFPTPSPSPDGTVAIKPDAFMHTPRPQNHPSAPILSETVDDLGGRIHEDGRADRTETPREASAREAATPVSQEERGKTASCTTSGRHRFSFILYRPRP